MKELPGRTKLEVIVDLKELEKEQQWPNIVAYAFSRGRLLAKNPLKQDTTKPTIGKTEVELDPKEESLVIKIGRDVEDVRDLQRYNPVVKKVYVTPKKKTILSFDIDKPLWLCWHKVPYFVTGTIEKQVAGNKLPICFGEVDIYDVDIEYCLLRLPDLIIERLRDSIIDIVIDPPPINIPKIEIDEIPIWPQWDDDWCGTPPGKPPRPPHNVDVIKKLETLPPEWSFAKQRFQSVSTARSKISGLLEKMPLTDKTTWLNREAVEGVKISQILYTNTVQFQNLLVNNFQAFRFWLCWYPWIHWMWWPYCRWYSLEKLGTAEIQPDGSFSKSIMLSICRRDIPDLWFVARQELNNIDRVIYARYPVPCHTYWNHPSGVPVYLVTADPNAVVCSRPDPVDKEGIYVMPLGIGDDGWYEVHQAHIKPPTVPDSIRGLYNDTDPYGTRLDIQMQFHDGLRGIGVEYYRWSYRKETSDGWTSIETPITHRYLGIVAGKPVLEVENLGPKPVGSKSSLFLVPDSSKDWVVINRDDRTFGIWNTSGLPDGKYELRLEMFDTYGNNVTPDIAGFKYFMPTAFVGIVDDALNVESDGSVIFHLHLDNSLTVADIQSVALGGEAAAECQFLEYNDKLHDQVDVTYVAYHPNGFLDHYDLAIVRGISGTTADSISSTINASISTVQSFTVQDLLRQIGIHGPYDQCAFAIELHTWPRTRDGYNRIRGYEGHDTSAFALVKKAS